MYNIQDLLLAVSDHLGPLDKVAEKLVDELFFLHKLLRGKDILALVNKVMDAKLISVSYVLYGDDFFLQLIRDEITLHELILCRARTADNYSLEIWIAEKSLLHVLANPNVELLGSVLTDAAKAGSTLPTSLVLAWDI